MALLLLALLWLFASNLTWTPQVNAAGNGVVPQQTAPPTPAVPILLSLVDDATLIRGSGVLTVADEDIALFDPLAGRWQLYFDGSDVISRSHDVDAFKLLGDGSLLLSFNLTRTLSGLGEVTPNDVVKFTPTSLGTQTSGSFGMYLDGSDVGLAGASEDIDAVTQTAGGRLVISTRGSFNVPGVSGQDEDLIVLDNATFGENSAGTWRLYFDGSDVSLGSASEDVKAAWIKPGANQIYLATDAVFSVPGLTGGFEDVFICSHTSLGSNTSCSYSSFFDGSAHGFAGQHIDGLEVGTTAQLAQVRGAAEDNDEDGLGGGENQDAEPEDSPEAEEQNHRIFLPWVSR